MAPSCRILRDALDRLGILLNHEDGEDMAASMTRSVTMASGEFVV